jgi:uncharacterized cupin superfamily protein
MPKVDIDAVEARTGSNYPAKFAGPVKGRQVQGLGDAGGITQFGANLVTLVPGALSSLRHWHVQQDEFLVVTAGVCTLIDDHGETILNPGDCAAFPANDGNGHHLANRGDVDAQFVVIGTRTPTETGFYSDVDMMVKADENGFQYTRKDGTPYEGEDT